MAQVTEAIYSDGVLRPTTPLGLTNNQRVRLIVQVLQPAEEAERSTALEDILKDTEESALHLTAPLPSRDELHDRF